MIDEALFFAALERQFSPEVVAQISEIYEQNKMPPAYNEWRVSEMWSSSNPGTKVLWLSTGARAILADESHRDFIRWVGNGYHACS